MNLRILKMVLFTPFSKNQWGLPIICWGQPGIGKSAIWEAIGPAFGLPTYVLSPAEQGEGAFGAIPVPDAKATCFRYPPPDWVLNFQKIFRGLLLIDELQFAAGTMVEKPLLRLAREGAIGANLLPGGVRRVAAANPPEISGGMELLEALENRFGHYDVQFDFDAWKRWILAGANGAPITPIDPVAEEVRVMQTWDLEYRAAWSLVLAFLETHQHLAAPKSSEPGWQGKRARPSPRTWEYATRALAGAKIHGLNASEMEESYSMFVGVETGAQFAYYIEHLDLPSPESVLDSGIWRHNPARLDVTSIVLQSCTAFAVRDTSNKQTQRIGALWELLDRLCDDGLADLCIPVEEVLVTSGYSTENAAYSKAAEKVLSRTRRTLRAVKEA